MTLRKPGGITNDLPPRQYRTATRADYARIVQLLMERDGRLVLVRSLFRSDTPPYPLRSISKGPYTLSPEGIEGFSLEGEPYAIRITENDLHNVEIRRGQGEWMAPEMGSIILLIVR
jgi:hypothetical protein